MLTQTFSAFQLPKRFAGHPLTPEVLAPHSPTLVGPTMRRRNLCKRRTRNAIDRFDPSLWRDGFKFVLVCGSRIARDRVGRACVWFVVFHVGRKRPVLSFRCRVGGSSSCTPCSRCVVVASAWQENPAEPKLSYPAVIRSIDCPRPYIYPPRPRSPHSCDPHGSCFE
jgi:hypothetical protein